VMRSGRQALAGLSVLLLACAATSVTAAQPAELPRIGPAPRFTLTNQDGVKFSLDQQRGKVRVVTFIFTGCSQACPLLTAKLVGVQRKLKPEAAQVYFAAITVDPLNDDPPTLARYARAQSADLGNFAFLTGSHDQVEDVARRYAVYWKTQADGNIDHAFLTTLIDREGTIRLQYLGTRFDPAEFEADVRTLIAEARK